MRYLLILTLLSLGLVSQAQDNAETETSADMQISEELAEHFDALETFVERVRGLEPQAPLQRLFPSRVDVAQYIEETFRAELTDEILAEDVRFYAAFGLMDPDIDLREVLISLYQDQVAGFYDTESKEMNVILLSGQQPEARLPLLEQIVYVHEYVHVLQDQNHDLNAFLTELEDLENRDRVLASLALVEGDATTIMNLYTTRIAEQNPLRTSIALLAGGLQAGNLTLPAGLPDILGTELLWPYNVGSQYVIALVDSRDWGAVDAAFDNPPVSTEQILHPQKYMAGEMPLTVELADAASVLGDSWSLAETGTLGEFYLSEYLNVQLEGASAQAAAAGWGGDTYRIYEDAGAENALAFALRLEWDSSAERAEFAQAQREYAATRFAASADDACYSSDAATLCYADVDGAGSLVTFAPSAEQARALLQEAT